MSDVGCDKHKKFIPSCDDCIGPKMVAAITDGLIIPENITIDQRYRFEQTIKSLRASIKDLQNTIESIAYFEGNKETPNIGVSRNGAIKAYTNNIYVAKKALQRLKAAGNYVEKV